MKMLKKSKKNAMSATINVIREGSRWFNVLVLVHKHPACIPYFSCEDVVREGSVQSNHPELM